MPRNGAGVYSLPQPPFVSNTTISAAAVNSDFNDIATALTGSMPRDGQASMTGPLTVQDGMTIAPSITFVSDLTTGFSRDVVSSVSVIEVDISGTKIGTFSSAGWTGTSIGTTQVGTILDFAGSTAPSLWYQCYGQPVNRSTFSALFTAIGTTYGSGNGTTTFNLPDLRGVYTGGYNNMGGSASSVLNSTYYGANPNVLGTAGGSQSHVMTSSELVAHTHTSTFADGGHAHSVFANSNTAANAGVTVGGPPSYVNVANTGSGSANLTTTINNTGSSAAFTLVQPTMVMNKIIYAGV
jgi:microcystin-dependent protein